ncbi:hypothetical protein FGG08_005811 [Glutinoglossum americanum]|uniref:Uncharacterized protein n=1 Tax=Glutinoglossum americanum TaxID=1670608 RepID=A0A9P8HXE9_9PEZI|nr:hypothetical protein FGG08_005811 [Glutinoglossum americanum]
MTGKRKRKSEEILRAPPKDLRGPDSEPGGVQEAFRRHFEAQFKPLDSVNLKTHEVSTSALETDSDSEWDGFSEAEGKILYGQPGDESDDVTDAASLRNDLALQRLLTESHLLDPQSSYSPTGANRHKANDLRLQSLGSKSSILTQDKVPMSHRRGMMAKKSEREERRRQEAKENGIILEKVKKVKRANLDRRERSIGGPGVGMFKKGMLRLNKRDVAEIEGPKGYGRKCAMGPRH